MLFTLGILFSFYNFWELFDGNLLLFFQIFLAFLKLLKKWLILLLLDINLGLEFINLPLRNSGSWFILLLGFTANIKIIQIFPHWDALLIWVTLRRYRNFFELLQIFPFKLNNTLLLNQFFVIISLKIGFFDHLEHLFRHSFLGHFVGLPQFSHELVVLLREIVFVTWFRAVGIF